ncbi:hypothetical protein JW906_06710 [bacterium]|nr:hypothetical protein [bacterium]
MKKVFITGLLIAAWALCPAQDLIQGMYSYTYGDSESKVDARETCKNLALRDALESYAVYVESSTRIENYQLTSDEIRSLSAGVLRNIEIVEEKEEGRTLTLVVNATVDPGEIQAFMDQQKGREPSVAGAPAGPDSLPDFQTALSRYEEHLSGAQKELDRRDYMKAVLALQESERLIEKYARTAQSPFNRALYRLVADRSSLLREMAKLHYIRNSKNRILEQGQVRTVKQRSVVLFNSQEMLRKAKLDKPADEIVRKKWINKSKTTLKTAKQQVSRNGKRR